MVLQHFLKSMLLTFLVTADYFYSDQSQSLNSDRLTLKSYPAANDLQLDTSFNNDNSIPKKILPNSEMEEIADELQKEIDELRAQIQEIMDKSESSTSEEELKLLQKQMADLQQELQECYKKLDQLSSELQQEFRQKLDQLQREMTEANKKLEDRITELEEAFERLLVAQCIGNLRDGNPHTAVGTFRQLKNPLVHIANIITSAYRNVNDCSAIVTFLYELRLDVFASSQSEKNEVRATGYSSLYDQLFKDQFVAQGSDCTYQMAWQVTGLQKSLNSGEINAKNILDKITSKLPLSVSDFTKKANVRLIVPDEDRKFIEMGFDREGTGGTSVIFVPYYHEWSTKWSSDGLWFMMDDPNDHSLISQQLSPTWIQPCLSNSKSGSIAGTAKSLWKPVAVSNEQFYLLNKETGGYLAYSRASIGGRQYNRLQLTSIEYKTIFKVT